MRNMQTSVTRSEFAVTSESTSSLEFVTLSLLNDFASTSLSREHSSFFEQLTGVALPTSEIRLLEYLSGRDPVPASTIATALVIDPSRTSRLVRRLERVGYIGREPDPVDGRRTLLHLTAEAQTVMNTSLLRFTDRYLQMTANWADTDVSDLNEWLQHVYRGLTGWLPDRPTSQAGRVWRRLVANGSDYSAAQLELGETAILVFTWISQARWFEYLLESRSVPLGQQTFLSLCAIERRGPLPVAKLGEITWVDHTQASKRISRLDELGLVERAVDSFDRRSSLVRCSRRGTALVRHLADEQLGDLEAAVGPVEPTRRAQWTELMHRYLTTLTEQGLLLNP
ncbi:hypothetical protein GCM10009676_05300 [Prauserella halophila]|uniref:HTH marR-type domain-containing protein n=1 Tax=Prauserella halophila TaxID=185641 RepID=A0ABN1VXC2_9PSEU|nr:MarR family transcriptional regulator [Prauserella halophila]MCP2237422.1 DNA-binding transcriptional regulator, MarR family [Prauserella halophila]